MKKSRNNNAGFTLIELLTATTMTTMVVSALGFGLAQILQENENSTNLTYARVELNRAADRMVDDIHSSKKIEYTANLQSTVLPPNAQPVLVLNGSKIIYYQNSPDANSVWYGPKVLWRWEEGKDAKVLIDRLDTVRAETCGQSCARVIQVRGKQTVTVEAVSRAR